MSTAVVKLSFQEFISQVEGLINSVIQTIVQDSLYNWDEDYITRQILAKFRQNFRRLKIQYRDKTKIEFESSAFKLGQSLHAEYKFGDIAIIVKISYADFQLEGVAFIEAKRRYEGGTRFLASNIEQMERIRKNTPHPYLILYDYEPINRNENFKFIEAKKKFFVQPLHASLLPLNLAEAVNWNDDRLYRFSTSFSYQFAYRYLHGLDLDFSDEALAIAKGYRREEGIPRYVLTVSAAYGEQNSEAEEQNFESVRLSQDIGINSEVFIDIDDSNFTQTNKRG